MNFIASPSGEHDRILRSCLFFLMQRQRCESAIIFKNISPLTCTLINKLIKWFK